MTVNPELRDVLEALCCAVGEREVARGAGTVFSVASITRSGTTATLDTGASLNIPIGYVERMFLYGADQSEYNGMHTLTSVHPGTVPTILSITRSGTTATVTTAEAHGMSAGETITIAGCTQPEYNGTKTITNVPTPTTIEYTVSGSPATPATGTPTATALSRLTFEVSGSPATPATGTISARRASTRFTYDASGSTKRFPIADDFEDMPVRREVPPALPVLAIAQVLGTFTVRCLGHGLRAGDLVTIAGANEDGYNGIFTVAGVPAAVSISNLTRSGSTVTVTTAASHGLTTGDIVYIAGASPTNYNGAWGVTVTGSNTFTYSITGTPSTPASGTMTVKDYSRFTYQSESAYPSATGTVTATPRRGTIYQGLSSGGTATVYARNHGLNVGEWVHIEHDADTTWRLWVQVTARTSNTFDFADAAGLGAQTYSSSAGFWYGKVQGVRPVIQELRTAIEALPGTASAAAARFVEDDGAYETTVTIAGLLTAGSFGSSWLGLSNCTRESAGDVLEQMREVLDGMTFITANLNCITSSYVTRAGSGASQSSSWSDLLAASDGSGTPGGQILASIGQERATGTSYLSSAVRESTQSFSWLNIPGTFTYGSLTVKEYNNQDIDSDAMEVTDDDADVWTFDAALGTAGDLKRMEKGESWFSANPKSFDFTTTLPASHPFDSLAVGEVASRVVYPGVVFSGANSGIICRELGVGTDLLYG